MLSQPAIFRDSPFETTTVSRRSVSSHATTVFTSHDSIYQPYHQPSGYSEKGSRMSLWSYILRSGYEEAGPILCLTSLKVVFLLRDRRFSEPPSPVDRLKLGISEPLDPCENVALALKVIQY